MTDVVIRADRVGKRYRLGTHVGYQTLRERINRLASAPWRNLRGQRALAAPGHRGNDEFWALKDVSFEVGRGEVVGIIGRNGAGKSTLLKILSRITEPTEGAADLYGRVGSLLEVGTGFHAELTGRENVYLNGAILGMRRAEIARQFDAIVDFAEVEQFLDTPVKHYSSGMYMRLAFAVAAHLEPQILIVDEVLAVGDVDFQRKCIGKLGQVADVGRTVLVVSHNMGVIRSLCSRVIALSHGRVVDDGSGPAVVDRYLQSGRAAQAGAVDLRTCTRFGGTRLRLTHLSLNDGRPVLHGEPLVVRIAFETLQSCVGVSVGFGFSTMEGIRLLSTDTDAAERYLATGRRDLAAKQQRRSPSCGRPIVAPAGAVHAGRWGTDGRHGRPGLPGELPASGGAPGPLDRGIVAAGIGKASGSVRLPAGWDRMVLATGQHSYEQHMSNLFDRLGELRILVAGDVMLDRYIQGTATRLSAEAPVPVVRMRRSWATPGGAGHVAACLAGLRCQVTVAGLVGADAAAADLRVALANARVADVALVESRRAGTVTKTRILAGDFHQLLRLDEEPEPAEWGADADALGRRLEPLVAGFDAVVLADYDKGSLSPHAIGAMIVAARRAGRPVVVDPKKADLTVYAGASVLTPNVLEAERLIGRRFQGEDDLKRIAQALRNEYRLDAMLITRGPHGMTGADADGVFQVPARVREVADVTGAGDTVVAVLAAALAAQLGIREGCALASLAAGIAVSHHGTYVVPMEELRAALGGTSPKILNPESAQSLVQWQQALGRQVVFTNGCFDLFHAGHLTSLEQAHALGDFLVVGLNSDVSVRLLKGPSRPIVPASQRAALLAGLACVDLVVLFDDPTPECLVRQLAPNVLVKGGDYDAAAIAGGEFVQGRGGKVVTLPLVDGMSTSRIVQRIRDGG